MEVVVTLVVVGVVAWGVYYYIVKPRATLKDAAEHVKEDVKTAYDKWPPLDK